MPSRPWAAARAKLWFDNLATAVAEHEGNLVRFNPRFLAFAREYDFIPRACHVAAAWEKGKVERAIGYVRQNFWPLRSFADLSDVNSQARRWLAGNRQPAQASRDTARLPMTVSSPRRCGPCHYSRQTTAIFAEPLVHKDLRLTFDGNRYCVPPRYVGRQAYRQSGFLLRDHLRPDPRDRELCALLGTRPDLRRRTLPERTLRADGRGATLGRVSSGSCLLLGPVAEAVSRDNSPIRIAPWPGKCANSSN